MTLTIDQVLEKIRVYIAIHHNGKQKGLADQLGVSETFISYVLTKRKTPSKKILDLIGVDGERVSVYTFKDKETKK